MVNMIKIILLILLILGINGVILLLATTHLRKTSQWRERALSSFAIFLFTTVVVGFSGMHMCNEGSPPSFVMLATGVVAGIFPWLYSAHPWLIRGLIFITVTMGMFSAKSLASSYHLPSITGNPKYTSGRFWHTAFTGQYPRDHEKMAEIKEIQLRKRTMAESSNRGAGTIPAPEK